MRQVSISCALLILLLSLLSVLISAKDVGFLQWSPAEVGGRGRNLLQVAPSSSEGIQVAKNGALILAGNRTDRPNPLNNFNRYTEGWNLSSTDYWASVGFTAAPGFALSILWVAFGLLLALLACFCCCCCRDRARGKHEGGTLFPLLLLLLCTAAAIAGSVLLYTGQVKFHDGLMGTLRYVVNESDTVVRNLQNVTGALTGIESIGVETYVLSTSEVTRINQLNTQLTDAAATLKRETNNNSEQISTAIDKIRKTMIVVSAVMLLLVLLGFLFAVLGVSVLIYMLVFIGWFLVAGTWILCGVYILLNNAAGDTCVAMQEWVSNPYANTALDEILPCVDVATADQSVALSKEIVNVTTNGINSIMATSVFGSSVPQLCNPVQPGLNPSNCIDYNAAPQAWRAFVCSNSSATTGCIPENIYMQLNTSVYLINSLYVYTPFLVDLEDCTFVRNAFSNIQKQHCHGLQEYSKWQYIGLALISGGASLSILFWIVYIRNRRHRHRRDSAYEGNPKHSI